MRRMIPPGLGIGWRPEIAPFIDRRSDLRFVELLAENEDLRRPNHAVERLRERGLQVIPHGVSASFGSVDGYRPDSVRHLAGLARRYGSPLVSEHVAFVRAGGREAGHLIPVERTRAQLDVLVENVNRAQELLPVPIALENIAALFDWPGAELEPAEFLLELLQRTGALLLLDIANLHANAINTGADPLAFLRAFPRDRVAYLHVGGGHLENGIYHDSHLDPVDPAVFALIAKAAELGPLPGLMLERDGDYPPELELQSELDRLAMAAGWAKPA
jgi:uncharacterized protein (UPF0276 family)